MKSLSSLTPVGKIGRYEVIGRLAMGGMAEIFLARESGPETVERHVVVKRVLPHVAEDARASDMFVHEARLCMNLSHPNICPIYEFGDAGGSFFLAMEWVRGVSLRELLDRVKGPLPIPLLVRVFADIAGALHHAHTRTDGSGQALSIVHRDVTPENIMIGFDGVPKLLDFGVAKAATQKHKTEAGNLKGKFAYISPEQYHGHALDGRSDVFSLGVCMYEALTGKNIYERASEYETVAAIVLDPEVPSVRESRADVPDELDAIVRRAMAKERDERTPSADEVQEALLAFASAHGASQRHADVARAVRALVPDLAEAPPELDRRPPTQTGRFAAEAPRARTASGEMEALLLTQEADEDADELLGSRRRGGRLVAIVSVIVILLSIAVVGWVITRPRAPAPPAEPSSDASAAR
ncbi:MAG: serine/threonine protein kinase [Sandaracinaceae bacterium]|nr:serine/threonine protein kinase [Sandaracinaceae bacterium]